MDSICKAIRHVTAKVTFFAIVAGVASYASAGPVYSLSQTEAQHCTSCNLNQEVFPALNDLNQDLVHLVDVGVCPSEEVRELRAEGFTASEIRELCRKESEEKSRRSRKYDFYNVGSHHRPPAFRCGSYKGPVCTLQTPLLYGTTCYCDSNPGQAF